MVAPGSYMDDASVWGAVALASGKHHTTRPASWRGSRTSCIICIVTCRRVELTYFGCAAGASAAALARANNPEGALAELQRRWRAAELLEVRAITGRHCRAIKGPLRHCCKQWHGGVEGSMAGAGQRLCGAHSACGRAQVRLDLTVLWCYALGRELLRNFASPEGIQVGLLARAAGCGLAAARKQGGAGLRRAWPWG